MRNRDRFGKKFMSMIFMMLMLGIAVISLGACSEGSRPEDPGKKDGPEGPDRNATYKIDLDGEDEFYENVKESYHAGDKVEIYYIMIVTDSDVTIYLDGEPVRPVFTDEKGFRIEFTMPDHDVSIRTEWRNTEYPGD